MLFAAGHAAHDGAGPVDDFYFVVERIHGRRPIKDDQVAVLSLQLGQRTQAVVLGLQCKADEPLLALGGTAMPQRRRFRSVLM